MRSEDDRRIDLEQVRVHSAEAGIAALKDDCQELHAKAARLGDTEAAMGIRRQADDRDESAEDIRGALHRGLWRREPVTHLHNHGAHTDQRGASGNSSIVQFEQSKFLWLMTGVALGLALLAIYASDKAEREAKLAREDMRVMSIALAKRGIDTDEHATEKGEDK